MAFFGKTGFFIGVGGLIPTLLLASGLATGSVFDLPSGAGDEVYPTRPITLVTGFSAGDGPDMVVRHLADVLSQELGQPVIVSNRPGSAGNVAAAAVAIADPDGYTVNLAVRPSAPNRAMLDSIPIGYSRNLEPVGMIAHLPYVLVMGKHVAAETLHDAVALAREKPGVFTCASAGPGSTAHVLCETLGEKAGLSWEHIAYDGATPAVTEVIGGEADFAIVTVAAALRFIKWDLVRPLAVFAVDRVAAIPSVPAIEEYGYGDVRAQGWYAIAAPAGTPAYAVARLNRAINAMHSKERLREKLVKLGYVLPAAERNSPEEAGIFLAEDAERWTRVVEQRGMEGL
ncbi:MULTISPECIES: tripartite tricarboxylate transporter substrate binding protein [unclassified Achromobacter]|uniref:Bug family tripartite tricarboxylate transporter substrate binding protein n=1 Tax=unclassified Achromobacter TaxID=2626865 RepID=UPI000B51C74C|nr:MULTISPECIES: tripartite tricarboxylate transporter substrate binding protein [unclassified Achromobacter]OWT80885.1 hypothetical protein CEY05_05820 [Achromobacter sp. HZ34]OWT81401.1 hypothetical protein CEY04_05810 [Achromobacter sp. HZ28]